MKMNEILLKINYKTDTQIYPVYNYSMVTDYLTMKKMSVFIKYILDLLVEDCLHIL